MTHPAICRGWSMDEVCAFCIFLGSSGQLGAAPADETTHRQTYSHYARTIPECINHDGTNPRFHYKCFEIDSFYIPSLSQKSPRWQRREVTAVCARTSGLARLRSVKPARGEWKPRLLQEASSWDNISYNNKGAISFYSEQAMMLGALLIPPWYLRDSRTRHYEEGFCKRRDCGMSV